MSAVLKQTINVDKIVSDLSVFVDSSDLNSIRELWSYLEGKFFARLAPSYTPVLTYVKSVDEMTPFSTYTNKSYREAFFVSIKNFLNVIYHRTWAVSEVCPKNQYTTEIMDDFFSIAQPKT